jgi:hypothetical protein
MKPSRLAVDTNVLLDIADEVDEVLDAVNVIDDRLPDVERLGWTTAFELSSVCDIVIIKKRTTSPS